MDPADEYAPVAEPPPAVPAATLVIFRHDPAGGPAQLLIVERSTALSFAGGAVVFPGGRVDDADRELALTLGGNDPDEELAARIAAVRETLEETGLAVGFAQPIDAVKARAARELLLAEGTLAPVLARFGWTLDRARLIPFARWRPRHNHRRVYDTRFYLADLGTGAVDLTVDATENTRLFWASAAEALRMAEERRIKMIFPTRRNLERLAQFADFTAARAHAELFPVRTISPYVEQRAGTDWLCIPEGRGYPVTSERFSEVERG
ncbi:MAG: NUDIX domain-containing protein [Novosphingobium sp.]